MIDIMYRFFEITVEKAFLVDISSLNIANRLPPFYYLCGMQQIEQHIQAIIFTSPVPATLHDIKTSMEKSFQTEITEEQILVQIDAIMARFATDSFGFELKKTGGGFQFLSKSDYYATIHHFINTQQKKKLSKSSLETLSIIAYNEGITKAEIEQIRGVASDYSVEKLLEKELIEMCGKKDAPGNPMMYKISPQFLDYFGLNSMEELPKLKDIIMEQDNTIGEESQNA